MSATIDFVAGSDPEFVSFYIFLNKMAEGLRLGAVQTMARNAERQGESNPGSRVAELERLEGAKRGRSGLNLCLQEREGWPSRYWTRPEAEKCSTSSSRGWHDNQRRAKSRLRRGRRLVRPGTPRCRPRELDKETAK
ncbi:hypothetical protein F444_01458 [Phytophthora nicotianae P1976]|uniref:Uncharacterized protein n=1 Tax=Phytophthora nicotianae P1976 TaxID=1317066 RepID=A0A081B0K5_PHYNI|nr:hypothetical protein F444_01458 [Phytophthora nicotianae P1976]